MTNRTPDPYRLHVIVVTIAFTVTIPAIMAATFALRPDPPVDPFAADAELLGVTTHDLLRGESIYARTCTRCHGADANGVPRLGKPLRNSEYVQTHTDDELLAMITDGRGPDDPANTTGIPMPPRADQGLADDQIEDVVHYLRTLQEPGAPTASLEGWMTRPEPAVAAVVASPAEAEDAPASSGTSDDVLADASGTPRSSGSGAATAPAKPAAPVPTEARNAFVTACSSCHAPDGTGLPNSGKPLTTSEFVASKTDKELMTFIKTGRPMWDPENTTGVDMPPKGGNPALTDDDITKIIRYIRFIQENSSGTSDTSSDLLADASGAPRSNGSEAATAPATPAAAPAPTEARNAFVTACSSCHAPDGTGLPNSGKPLTTSEFVASKTDKELMTFIKTGRPMWDPENTTGVDMPPKGGNPALTDDDITKIIRYIRFIQENS